MKDPEFSEPHNPIPFFSILFSQRFLEKISLICRCWIHVKTLQWIDRDFFSTDRALIRMLTTIFLP